MLIAKFIRVNLALIVVVGFYGTVIDEPYWRDVGHGPWLYDYLFWFALILNGPVGVYCRVSLVAWFKQRRQPVRNSVCLVVRAALAAMEALPPACVGVPGKPLEADDSLHPWSKTDAG